MPTTTTTLTGLLHSGIDEVKTIIAENRENTWSRIASEISTKEGFYDLNIISGLGDFTVVGAGSPVPSDNKFQVFRQQFYPLKFAKAYDFDYEAEVFDVYNEIARISDELARTATRTKNKVVANLLNNAFSTSYPIYDTVALCSASHTGVTGTTPFLTGGWSNTTSGAASALGPIALETAQTSIMNQCDVRGEPMLYGGGKLVLHVPNALFPLATRIVEASGLAGTNDNDPNFSGRYVNVDVQPYLTSSTAWFLKAVGDRNHGLRLIQFNPMEIWTDKDARTVSKIIVAHEMYTTAVTQWQGLYGSQGA